MSSHTGDIYLSGRFGRPIAFIVVGGLCFTVQIGVLAFLAYLGMFEPLANAIGFALSTQLNFLVGRRFTWPDREAGMTALLSYYIIAMISLGANTVVFASTYRSMGIGVAAVFATAVSATLNYVACNYVVFGRPNASATEVAE